MDNLELYSHALHDIIIIIYDQVRGEATVREVDGRKIKFDVLAFDEKEKIAEGTHERFILNQERFMKKAQDKKQQ